VGLGAGDEELPEQFVKYEVLVAMRTFVRDARHVLYFECSGGQHSFLSLCHTPTHKHTRTRTLAMTETSTITSVPQPCVYWLPGPDYNRDVGTRRLVIVM